MASPFHNRAITPNITSLSHLCVMKVALRLWRSLGQGLLTMVLDTIQRGETTDYYELIKDMSPPYNHIYAVHNCLGMLPTCLRKKVVEAGAGLELERWKWEREHGYIPGIKDKKHITYWQSDGTVDRIKTAQQLIIDSDIDIMTRFEVACNYCQVEHILTLWKQLEVSRNTEHFNKNSFMVSFWVQRIRGGSGDPWPKAALEYLDSLRRYSRITNLACCRSIFPFLQVVDRERFLVFFRYANADDLRFCLYTMTKEEQEEVLGTCALNVLHLYFKQPLRRFFLEIAKEIWNYIDETTFGSFVDDILLQKDTLIRLRDWDGSILEDFWNMGSDSFRERARKNSYFKDPVDLFFNEKKRKAEDEMNEQMKKFRSDTD